MNNYPLCSVTSSTPTVIKVIGPQYGPVAGGTRLTLVGQSLTFTSPNMGKIAEISTTSYPYTSVSGISIGNYTAVVDRVNRLDYCEVVLKRYYDVVNIGGMHYALCIAFDSI